MSKEAPVRSWLPMILVLSIALGVADAVAADMLRSAPNALAEEWSAGDGGSGATLDDESLGRLQAEIVVGSVLVWVYIPPTGILDTPKDEDEDEDDGGGGPKDEGEDPNHSPEPSTLVLCGIGLGTAGLSWWKRRRRSGD